jgi:hypothetical protein
MSYSSRLLSGSSVAGGEGSHLEPSLSVNFTAINFDIDGTNNTLQGNTTVENLTLDGTLTSNGKLLQSRAKISTWMIANIDLGGTEQLSNPSGCAIECATILEGNGIPVSRQVTRFRIRCRVPGSNKDAILLVPTDESESVQSFFLDKVPMLVEHAQPWLKALNGRTESDDALLILRDYPHDYQEWLGRSANRQENRSQNLARQVTLELYDKVFHLFRVTGEVPELERHTNLDFLETHVNEVLNLMKKEQQSFEDSKKRAEEGCRELMERLDGDSVGGSR